MNLPARPAMRGFKIAHAELREQLKHAEAQVRRLFQKRKTIAKLIPANDLEVLKMERKVIDHGHGPWLWLAPQSGAFM